MKFENFSRSIGQKKEESEKSIESAPSVEEQLALVTESSEHVTEIESEIEDMAYDYLVRAGVDSHMIELLSDVTKESKSFLKKISKEVAQFPEKVGARLRDNRLTAHAKHVQKFQTTHFPRYSVYTDFDLDVFFTTKLAPLLEEANSPLWGKSEKEQAAFDALIVAIRTYIDRVTHDAPQNEDGIFRPDISENLVRCVNTATEITCHDQKQGDSQSKLATILHDVSEYIMSDISAHGIPKEQEVQTLVEKSHHNPLILMESLRNRETKEADQIRKECIDSIMNHYSPHGLSKAVGVEFNEYFQNHPEDILNDPDKRKYLHEMAKEYALYYSCGSRSKIRENFLVEREKKNITEEEVNRMIDTVDSYDLRNESVQTMISSFPLSEDNLAHYFSRRFDDQDYEEGKGKIPWSKESYLRKKFDQKISEGETKDYDNPFLVFMQYDAFHLSVEERLHFFDKVIAADRTHTDNVNFFATILENYAHLSEGIPEDIFKKKLTKFLYTRFRLDNSDREVYASDIHHIFSLIDEYPIFSQSERTELFSAFVNSLNYTAIVRLTTGRIRELINNHSERTPSIHDEWLQRIPEAQVVIESLAYRDMKSNDVRHLFFEVLDGVHQVENFDALVHSYLESLSGSHLDAETFLSIFFVRKTLDKRYLGDFMRALPSRDSTLAPRLQELKDLGSISAEEYREALFSMVNLTDSCPPVEMVKLLFDFYDDDSVHVQNTFNEYVRNLLEARDADTVYLEADYLCSNLPEGAGKKFALHALFESLIMTPRGQAAFGCFFGKDHNLDSLIEYSYPASEDRSLFIEKVLHANNPFLTEKILHQVSHYPSIFSQTGEKEYIHFSDSQFIIERLQDATTYKQFFTHSLELADVGIYSFYLEDFMSQIPEDDAQRVVESIRKKGRVIASDDRTKNGLFLARLLSTLEGETASSKYFNGSEQEIFQSYFIDNGEAVSDAMFETVSQNVYFFEAHEAMVVPYLQACLKRGISRIGYMKILKNFMASSKLSIPETEARAMFQEAPLTADSYLLYVDQIRARGGEAFTLSQEQFNQSIERMIEGNTRVDVRELYEFFIAQHFITEKEVLRCTDAQEEKIIRKIINRVGIDAGGSAFGNELRTLKEINPTLFNTCIHEELEQRSRWIAYVLLKSGTPLVEGLEIDIIDDVVSNPNINIDLVEDCCKLFKASPFMKNIKDSVKELHEPVRSRVMRVLLRNDVLDPSELRSLYHDSTMQEDAREKVLSVAEIFGSLFSQQSQEKLENFLATETERNETRESLGTIRSFIDQYAIGEKGRTIVTMLFAREYREGENPAELCTRVRSVLEKYNRILTQYSTTNIPHGARVSIGFEYEVTQSTSKGYTEMTGRNFKNDMVRLSQVAHIGSGYDAVHEIAVHPTDNPYLLLLEVQLLQDLEYIDFNFDRSSEYQKGARGYHLTLGGERGLSASAETRFLQNVLIGASWGGIQAGNLGKRANGGRGVSLRNRPPGGNNVRVFENETPSVELRSLSIDKLEQMQRAILASYYGAVAIQVKDKLELSGDTETLSDLYTPAQKDERLGIENLRARIGTDKDVSDEELKIIWEYAKLMHSVRAAIVYHNRDFLNGETVGYTEDGVFVGSEEFGGTGNRKRFDSVVTSIDDSVSTEEYAHSLQINWQTLFSDFNINLSDSFSKLNNLYLKPSTALSAGDQANAISMLKTTKLGNEELEGRDEKVFLNRTMFDTLGERRNGYYAVQGGSEKMLTHAFQRALLEFTENMEHIVNAPGKN